MDDFRGHTSYNIDDHDEFQKCFTLLGDASTHNFTVNFGLESALCEVNLGTAQIESKIEQASPQCCRWFNFWGWNEDHEAAINIIARKYEVSPRLTHLLCPRKHSTPTNPSDIKQPTRKETGLSEGVEDLEKAFVKTSDTSPTLPNVEHRARRKQLTSLSDVVDDLWHFSSVDWGRRYVCIGLNGLFMTSDRKNPDLNKPNAQRIWSALLLCDDGTVISVFEAPQSSSPDVIHAVRKNQLNVFLHLSRTHVQSASHQNALMQVNIRPLKPNNYSNGTPLPFDTYNAACLLFYYLFDDWITIYGLISGREHPYRDRLESLRRKMSHAPEVEDVESLHRLGRQLTVIKRVYESYESVVNQILRRQRLLAETSSSQPSNNLHRVATLASQHRASLSSSSPHSITPDPYFAEPDALSASLDTLRIATPAVARFERLLDRIRLYALTEIAECLTEKESLVWMNFNLLTLRNASAIEALTRTTILLAKATILFLPMSLMTAYFSTQFDEINEKYSLTTYWACFGVVGGLTVLLLVEWSWASKRVSGRVVYKGLGRLLWEDKRREKRVKES